MWAVNEADLSPHTASCYVHIVMLHDGLRVGLTVAHLLPLLPPPVYRLRTFLALCPSLCLPKCPQQCMRCFHAQEYLLWFPKCRLQKPRQTAVLLVEREINRTRLCCLPAPEGRSVATLNHLAGNTYSFFLGIIPSAADPPNGIEHSYRLCKFSRSVKLFDSSQQAV